MNMLWTTLGFLALTVLFATFHVRSSGRAKGARGEPKCPRCRTRIRGTPEFCPGCGAPLGAYEIVTARIASPDTATSANAPLHAIVRADMCVGCGTCVDACPEPGAIVLENKLARVNLDLCKGHGKCQAACPVGAVVVTADDSVQRVEVPQLDVNFQSNVPGLYVVGELGGRGLIKNAVNEGKLAVEHIAKTLPPGAPRLHGDEGAYDVVIVGSGPAGLSAGLEALASKLRYLILEQGTLSDTIAKYPRRKVLFAEPLRVPLYGDLWVADGAKESLLEVWQTVIAKTGLQIQTGVRVQDVRRAGGMFSVVTEIATYEAHRVVLAMGRRGTPRRLGVPGEALDKVFYDIVEMEAFERCRMLVVGGGDSAVESALGLAHQPGTTVTLSYRGEAFTRLRDRNRAKLDDAVAAGKIEVRLKSELHEIRPDVAVLNESGRFHLLPNDFVVIRIGGESAYPFLERIGVRIVQKEIAVAPAETVGVG
jgi:thioredoxin reductase (NADPH)